MFYQIPTKSDNITKREMELLYATYIDICKVRNILHNNHYDKTHFAKIYNNRYRI